MDQDVFLFDPRKLHFDEKVISPFGYIHTGHPALIQSQKILVVNKNLLRDPADFGFDLAEKLVVMDAMRESFWREFHGGTALKRELGLKFRGERRNLEQLLAGSCDRASPLAAGVDAFEQRSRQWAGTMGHLLGLADAGRLEVSIPRLAQSLVHLHVNRILRSEARAQELVLYDFLCRLYRSQAARERETTRGQRSMNAGRS